MKRSLNHLTFSILLVFGDVLAILGAYSFAYILRMKVSSAPVANFVAAETYFLSLLVLLPFIVLFFSLIGSYTTHQTGSKVTQAARLLVGAFGAMLFMITLDYFYAGHIFPAKLVPLYGLGLSIVLLAAARGSLYLMRWAAWRREGTRQSVVIIGDNNVARDVVAGINRRNSGYIIQAVVGSRRHKISTHKTFKEATAYHTPDVIIQIANSKQPTVDSELLDYAAKNYVQFKFIPSDVNDLPDKVRLELFMGDVPVLSVEPTALVGWGRLIKRLLDLAVSIPTLIILLPLLVVIGVSNRFVFGKVFFSQTRLTRGDQKFQLYKFQTIDHALNGLTPEQAFRKLGMPELIKPYRDNGDFLDNDPRYGKWARFLRKTSLDELPQLWNVIKGDISLVGPRALIPEELSGYSQRHLILNVKSGVTGLAQISGRRDLPWDQRRKLDVYYVQNWSLMLDIQILLRTAWQVIVGRGAQ